MTSGPIRPFGRLRGILPALAFSLVFIAPLNAHGQAASIGIYADASRSSCSLSDAGGGLIKAYVVASTQNGSTGVRFAAPKPACFNATWLNDEVAPGYFSIGGSQTDISIAFGGCVVGPTTVLTITFQKVSSTDPCCEFPLVASPIVGDVIFTDCAFTEHPMPVASGYINGNESCACTGDLDLSPSEPTNPSPQSGTINQPLSLSLYWEATDPEGKALHYDLYFGTDENPPLLAGNLTTNGYDVSGLAHSTKHYWKVVAFDPANQSAEGQVWNFTTGAPGTPPPAVTNPSPENGALGVARSVPLTWQDGAGGGVILGYDIHFGTTPTPPHYANAPAGQHLAQVSGLALNTTYYWYIVTVGNQGLTTDGPTWSFTTTPTNVPPTAPTNPTPANGSQSVSVNPSLTWSASDPDGQALNYDVYFGTTTDPPLMQRVTVSSLPLSGLADTTSYHWRVVAIDADGASTSGPEWTFKTVLSGAPSIPTLVSPANGSTTSTNVQLKWACTDPNGDPLSFAVYFGTSPTPPLYIAATTSKTVSLPTLPEGTVHYWKIIAKDTAHNLTTAGPVWTFTTTTSQPPGEPSNPNPSDGAVGVFRKPTLAWYCSDPDSPTLFYDVYFGTSPSPPLVTTTSQPSYTPVGPLASNALERDRTYFWKIVARDPQNHFTAGPVWSFTTDASNEPPSSPGSPFPADNATNQTVSLTLQWQSTDPEGLPLLYDVYFGSTVTPPRVATNITQASYPVAGLPGAYYYWKIVARDVDGNEVTGAQWRFRTSATPWSPISIGLYADDQGTYCRLADTGAGLRNVYVVVDGPATYTGCRFTASIPQCFDATWLYDTTPYVTVGDSPDDVSIGFGFCLVPPITVMTITYMSNGNTTGCCGFALTPPPIIGNLLVTDCAFAELVPRSYPVLGISTDNSCPPCEEAGYLRFSEAVDTCRVGPSRLITVDVQVSPVDSVSSGGFSLTFSPSLTFVSCERGALTQDWSAFDHNVVGNTLTISGAAHPGYDPQTTGVFARVTFETNCCEWIDPAELHLSDASGDFLDLRLIDHTLACRYVPDGDVNGDGGITVADAQCALNAYLYAPLPVPGGCGGTNYLIRSDVDCSGAPTPGDAYCIFRHWLDQSCSFCSGVGAAVLTAGPAPQVSLRVVREGDEIVAVLRANGAGTMDALGLELAYPRGLELIRVEPPRNDVYAALQTRTVEPGRVRIGAYANAGRGPAGNGDVIAIRFRAKDTIVRGTMTASRFVDALAGAADASASLDGAATTPPVNEVVLHQNSPNPFNPRTSIRFELPDAMRVRLRIFDVHGRLVKVLLDERRDAGSSSVDWDGRDENGNGVATGVYFYVLDAGSKRIQHKMVMLK